VLAQAGTATAMPEIGNPARAALARLWPIGAFAVIAGGLGFVFPGVSAVGAGFALAAALMWRSREGAVAAIEERDGVRFYVEPRSALQPVSLIRTPGLRRDRTLRAPAAATDRHGLARANVPEPPQYGVERGTFGGVAGHERPGTPLQRGLRGVRLESD
jgi:hypothetical protein